MYICKMEVLGAVGKAARRAELQGPMQLIATVCDLQVRLDVSERCMRDHGSIHMQRSRSGSRYAVWQIVVKGSGKVRNAGKEVSKGKVLRLHTVFGVLTQSEDLVSSLLSIYSSTYG